MNCNICPHQCNINRNVSLGRCHSGTIMRVAHVGLHMWEEPIISGSRGSGTIFFAGCNLSCRFCQNYAISHCRASVDSVEVSDTQLGRIMLQLQDNGAHNINLVSPMHYALSIASALQLVKHKLTIPVLYNTNSYELPTTLARLDGLVDIYLQDLKYYSTRLSQQLSGVADYYQVATTAIQCMRAQQPSDIVVDNIMQQGMIIRHLTLPGQRRDTLDVLEYIAHSDKHMYVSIMSQYTPVHHDNVYKYLNNTVTQRQYDSILEYADNLALDHVFSQQLASVGSGYVPNWDIGTVNQYLGENK